MSEDATVLRAAALKMGIELPPGDKSTDSEAHAFAKQLEKGADAGRPFNAIGAATAIGRQRELERAATDGRDAMRGGPVFTYGPSADSEPPRYNPTLPPPRPPASAPVPAFLDRLPQSAGLGAGAGGLIQTPYNPTLPPPRPPPPPGAEGPAPVPMTPQQRTAFEARLGIPPHCDCKEKA